MRLELDNERIVKYGFDRGGAVAYSCDRGAVSARHRQGRLDRTIPHHGHFTVGTVCTVEFSARTTAVAASVAVWSGREVLLATGTPLLECVLFDLATPGTRMPVHAPVGAMDEQQRVEDGLIEMRPAHRSLRDKAREEMSEFEHKYPW